MLLWFKPFVSESSKHIWQFFEHFQLNWRKSKYPKLRLNILIDSSRSFVSLEYGFIDKFDTMIPDNSFVIASYAFQADFIFEYENNTTCTTGHYLWFRCQL